MLAVFKNFILFWGIANLQRYDGFRWTTKELSHTYACIHSPPNSPPIQAATWHWAEFLVLYSRSLLVIHFKYSSVSMTISNSVENPKHHLLLQWTIWLGDEVGLTNRSSHINIYSVSSAWDPCWDAQITTFFKKSVKACTWHVYVALEKQLRLSKGVKEVWSKEFFSFSFLLIFLFFIGV